MSESEVLINRSGHYEESFFDKFVKPCLAEFIGTMLFVFIGCLSTDDLTLPNPELSSVGLAHGLMIALLIMGLGEVSGGHFNPAVSLGVLLSGTFSIVLFFGYVVAQILGGLIGAAFVRAVLPTQRYKDIHGGTHQLGPDVDKGWAILIETLLTLVLVFTVLMAAVNPKTKSKLAPLAIGFAVAVDILAGGPLTGASMNPARAFGPAVCSGAVIDYDTAWKYHYIYWLGPIAGALIAGILYRLFFTSPNQRVVARTSD